VLPATRAGVGGKRAPGAFTTHGGTPSSEYRSTTPKSMYLAPHGAVVNRSLRRGG